MPDRFSAVLGPKNRVGKIFIDYLRNGKGASTVAAFSARARSGMGVSMPVAWDELPEIERGRSMDDQECGAPSAHARR